MSRFDGTQFSCGLDAAVAIVGGKWKPLILWALHAAPRRFSDLRRDVRGVSEKMLTQQLRELEAVGIVNRTVFTVIPPRVEYSLTDLGQTLNAALVPLGDWAEENRDQILANTAATRTSV